MRYDIKILSKFLNKILLKLNKKKGALLKNIYIFDFINLRLNILLIELINTT